MNVSTPARTKRAVPPTSGSGTSGSAGAPPLSSPRVSAPPLSSPQESPLRSRTLFANAETARDVRKVQADIRAAETLRHVIGVLTTAEVPMTQAAIRQQVAHVTSADVSKKHVAAAVRRLPDDLRPKVIGLPAAASLHDHAPASAADASSANTNRGAIREFGAHSGAVARAAVCGGLAKQLDAPQTAAVAGDDPTGEFMMRATRAGLAPVVERRLGSPSVALTIWSDAAEAASSTAASSAEAALHDMAVGILRSSIISELQAEIDADPTRDAAVMASLIKRIGSAKADGITVAVWSGTWGQRVQYAGHLCPLEWPCLFDQALMVGQSYTTGLAGAYAVLTVTDTPWLDSDSDASFVAGLSDGHDQGRTLRDAIDDWYDAPPQPAQAPQAPQAPPPLPGRRRRRRFPAAAAAVNVRRMM